MWPRNIKSPLILLILACLVSLGDSSTPGGQADQTGQTGPSSEANPPIGQSSDSSMSANVSRSLSALLRSVQGLHGIQIPQVQQALQQATGQIKQAMQTVQSQPSMRGTPEQSDQSDQSEQSEVVNTQPTTTQVIRDYVETDRDYQNLLDLLGEEAKDKASFNVEDYVADNITVEEISRLIEGGDSSFWPADGQSISTTEQPDECSICLNSLANSNIKMLQCKHEFHTDCLDSWVAHATQNDPPKCPLCRSPIDGSNTSR